MREEEGMIRKDGNILQVVVWKRLGNLDESFGGGAAQGCVMELQLTFAPYTVRANQFQNCCCPA